METFNEGVYSELLEILQNLHPDFDFTTNR